MEKISLGKSLIPLNNCADIFSPVATRTLKASLCYTVLQFSKEVWSMCLALTYQMLETIPKVSVSIVPSSCFAYDIVTSWTEGKNDVRNLFHHQHWIKSFRWILVTLSSFSYFHCFQCTHGCLQIEFTFMFQHFTHIFSWSTFFSLIYEIIIF